MLVEFEANRSLLHRIALIQDLDHLLGINVLLGIDVDVVTPRALHRASQAQIVRDAQPYER